MAHITNEMVRNIYRRLNEIYGITDQETIDHVIRVVVEELDGQKFKTFYDLIFEDHPSCPGGLQAKMFFNNGYCVSVIQGPYFYTHGPEEWEVAIGTGTKDSWELCYDTHITDDVLGYQSKEDVTDVMREVQLLKAVDVKELEDDDE